jgi:hypothetical protein
VPNGDAVLDNCDVCDSDSSNDCVQDCTGQWGGTAAYETFWLDIDGDGLGAGEGYSLCNGLDLPGWVTNNDDADDACASNVHDECGLCDGDNSSCADCAGTPNGDSWVSDCGCVAADNDGNDCDDCFDTPNGTAWTSDCGCVPAGNSGDDCDDCAGTPNGSAYEDNCDVCDTNSDNDCVQDCAGTWGGSLVDDECGICGGDDSSCADECGVPNGDNSTCLDECGVPNGDNTSCADCAGVPNGDNVVDNCDTCDADSSNDCVQDVSSPPHTPH